MAEEETTDPKINDEIDDDDDHSDDDDDDDSDDEHRDFRSLLGSEDRDFLVRNNGEKVEINKLSEKKIGLYFSGSWCGACRRFTPTLVDTYKELASRFINFEIVFVSSDQDDEDFGNYFSEMPWLAIPFSDDDKLESLQSKFDVEGLPTLVVIDENGEVLTYDAADGVRDYGADGYPFTDEQIERLKKEEEAARLNQSIRSILVTTTRDYLVTSNFKRVPVSDLEGKIVGLYFTLSSFEGCTRFTRMLVNFYNDLKGRGVNFEIVLVSLEEDESSFMDDFEDMPWLGIPFKDKLCEKLVRYFELEDLPTLVVIGADGKTVNANAVELVEDYGVEAYPFTSKKLKELKKKEKARIENQTLQSLLISGDKDYVIKNDSSTVPVLDLVGKNILLYFSAHWCPPCRAFLPHLIEVYDHIKKRDAAFEIIFVSSDEDEESFDDYFSQMPWLALPFLDERKRFLARVFKVSGIPLCVAISPEGKTVTKEARNLIMEHGADAYPFNREQIRQLKTEIEEKAKQWPEKIRHKLHRHVLWKIRRQYICDHCGNMGRDWSFFCKKCDFDLHPHCALDDDNEVVDSDEDDEGEAWPGKIKHMLHKHALVKAWRHYQCDACEIVKQGWSYFCEECDFDLHPACALGNPAKAKVMDSDDDSDDIDVEKGDLDESNDDDTDSYESEDGDKIRYEDGGDYIENEHEVLISRHFRQTIQSGNDADDDDGDDEKEEEGKKGTEGKKENIDDNDDNDDNEGDDENNEDEDEDNEEEEDDDKNDEEDEEDDEDGPSMRGYVCDTMDRASSVSFQESIFTLSWQYFLRCKQSDGRCKYIHL